MGKLHSTKITENYHVVRDKVGGYVTIAQEQSAEEHWFV